jgi:hypothetical protein
VSVVAPVRSQLPADPADVGRARHQQQVEQRRPELHDGGHAERAHDDVADAAGDDARHRGQAGAAAAAQRVGQHIGHVEPGQGDDAEDQHKI